MSKLPTLWGIRRLGTSRGRGIWRGVAPDGPSRGETLAGARRQRVAGSCTPNGAAVGAGLAASAFRIEVRCRDADDDADRSTAKDAIGRRAPGWAPLAVAADFARPVACEVDALALAIVELVPRVHKLSWFGDPSVRIFC